MLLYLCVILLSQNVCGSALGGFCDNRETGLNDLIQAVTHRHRAAGMAAPLTRTPTPRHNLPTDEMVRDVGYPCETHYTTTEDGYILALHRIPHGKTNGDNVPTQQRPVFYLQHGLIASSADWVMPMPSKGLGYILADAGYDVWMGNFRGNSYSRNHTYLDPDVGADGFWEFSWDELARYDLPAMLDKILTVTGETELQYVGHSMGTTTMMALHHYKPEVTAPIRLAHFLAPVGYMSHMESPLAWLAGLGDWIDWVLDLLGVGEFLPSNLLMDCLATLFCNEEWSTGVCTNIIFLLCGYDQDQMNTTLLETLMHHTPAGGSTHTVLQYVQEYNTAGFHGFDWGSTEENFHHHQGEVPTYLPQAVTTPVALYYGDNDWLAAVEDVTQLKEELQSIVPGMIHEIAIPAWNHLDFLWGVDADKFVYSILLENAQTCWRSDCRQNRK